MKPLRIAALSLTAASLLASVSSCKSDPSPFDFSFTPVKTDENTARIRLKIDVASTRADDPMSTVEERKVTKVNIYVFDETNLLEKFVTDIDVTGDDPAEIEVIPGQKCIYAVAGKALAPASGTTPTDIVKGMSIANFEKLVMASTLADLKTTAGFMMVGKSGVQQVLKSANENEVPTSNIFNIELVRLLAKTQVKCPETLDASSFGFTVGVPTFCVFQTSDKMALLINQNSDIRATYTDSNGDGTYDEYTVCPDTKRKNAVTDAFTADGCMYMSENIVQQPTAGNTTFVSLCVPLTPKNFYTYNETTKELTATTNPTGGISYYAVGVVDETYGFEDFALDPTSHHVLTFKDKADADRYAAALNGGGASAITVSETEAPLKAPAASASDVNHRNFQSVSFELGKAYYRINITTGTGNMKVERNRFYKIEVKSISSLGFHSEDLLRPKDPASDPGNSTSAWIETVLTVAPWEESNQNANL